MAHLSSISRLRAAHSWCSRPKSLLGQRVIALVFAASGSVHQRIRRAWARPSWRCDRANKPPPASRANRQSASMRSIARLCAPANAYARRIRRLGYSPTWARIMLRMSWPSSRDGRTRYGRSELIIGRADESGMRGRCGVRRHANRLSRMGSPRAAIGSRLGAAVDANRRGSPSFR